MLCSHALLAKPFMATKKTHITAVPVTSDEDIDEALLTYIETESPDKWFDMGEYGYRKLTTSKAVRGTALIKLRKLIVPLVRKQKSARFCEKQIERRVLHLLHAANGTPKCPKDKQEISNKNS